MTCDFNRILADLNWSKQPKRLYEPIGYALSAGGKRVRPQLCLLGAAAVSGEQVVMDNVLPAALALEIFHNFTLLHDDVMDKAQVRRGRPCVHIRWDENTAILSGDQMLIEAYRMLSGVPGDKLAECLRLFNEMATGICEGQQLDMDFETREDVTLDDYREMIRLKTAVLLATALRIGAYIAGADAAMQQTLYEIGIHIGIAFQIEDDLLDCYGDEKTFGKTIGGDIREGKKTFMLLKAEQLKGGHIAVKGQPLEDVLALYDSLHVKEVAIAAIHKETAAAIAKLHQLPDTAARQTLIEMANKLQQRIQ